MRRLHQSEIYSHCVGMATGAGYDFVINRARDIAAYIRFSNGNPGEERYDAITLAIGINYRIRCNLTVVVPSSNPAAAGLYCFSQWLVQEKRGVG